MTANPIPAHPHTGSSATTAPIAAASSDSTIGRNP